MSSSLAFAGGISHSLHQPNQFHLRQLGSLGGSSVGLAGGAGAEVGAFGGGVMVLVSDGAVVPGMLLVVSS